MKEYNALTKQLLAEGYSANNYPDYVRIGSGQFTGDDPLYNMYGGFEYKRIYSDKLVYKTGCGKYVMGCNVITHLYTMGVEWTHENDCPVVRCPYDKTDCILNDERLQWTSGSTLYTNCWCVCHRTEETYDFGNSIEKAKKERHDEMERKYEEFSKAHNGRVCRNHMRYNELTREWNMAYEPAICAKMCYSHGFCPILGRALDKKRGNVYYDIKLTYRRYDLDGTLFEGQVDTQIIKGNRYFDRPVSMDICRNFVKLSRDEVDNKVRMKYHRELFFAEYHGKQFSVEAMNVMAETKKSRDLLQDLEDIKNGIQIQHASDNIMDEKERKKARRQQAQEKHIQRLEKKIMEVGYENLEDYSLDKIHADKWLTRERIKELEEMRQQKIKEEQEKPVQMSLFDYI